MQVEPFSTMIYTGRSKHIPKGSEVVILGHYDYNALYDRLREMTYEDRERAFRGYRTTSPDIEIVVKTETTKERLAEFKDMCYRNARYEGHRERYKRYWFSDIIIRRVGRSTLEMSPSMMKEYISRTLLAFNRI